MHCLTLGQTLRVKTIRVSPETYPNLAGRDLEEWVGFPLSNKVTYLLVHNIDSHI